MDHPRSGAPAREQVTAAADPVVAVPYRYLISALIALGAFGALLPIWSGSLLGFWLAPDLLLMTHVLTLGFLTMTVIGASLELLPAALGVARRLDRLAGLVYYPYVLGVALLLIGFATSSAGAQVVGGALLAVAIVLYLAVLIATLSAATIDALTDTYVVAAFATFLVAALLGIVLLLNATSGVLAEDHTPRLATHAGMAIGGWLTLMLYAAAYRFLPLLSPAHRPALHGPAQAQLWLTVLGLVLLLVAGLGGGSQARLLTGLAVLLVAAGAVLFVWQLARLYTRGQHVAYDVTYPFAMSAALLWLAALCITSGAVWAARPFGSLAYVVAGWLSLFGWAGMMVIGHLYRVDVLLAWLDHRSRAERLARDPRRPLLARRRRLAAALRRRAHPVRPALLGVVPARHHRRSRRRRDRRECPGDGGGAARHPRDRRVPGRHGDAARPVTAEPPQAPGVGGVTC